jgi:transcriptional regulator with XRE-family HTH domain
MVTGALARVLGDELRAARRLRHWTRKEVLRRLPSSISEPTLATYECGSRPLSVIRLVDLCRVLEVCAPDLLARAMDRTTGLPVDLHAIARDERAELQPLRRWARVRLRGTPAVTSFAEPAVESLAELCGMSVADLDSALRNGKQK